MPAKPKQTRAKRITPFTLAGKTCAAGRILRTRLSLDVQRAAISIGRKLRQGAQVEIEGNRCRGAAYFIRAGNCRCFHQQRNTTNTETRRCATERSKGAPAPFERKRLK